MRTSADFFNQEPSRFETLNTPFVPRPTVPFSYEKLSSQQKLPVPKVNYPVFTRPSQPVPNTALEQIQLQIKKEVSDLQQKKPTLDQLIQSALKQKIQHDQRAAQQKIVTIKKINPPPPNPFLPQKPLNRTRQFWWPSKPEVPTPKPVSVKPLKAAPQFANLPTKAPAKINLAPVKTTIEPDLRDVPINRKKSFLSQFFLLAQELGSKLTKLQTPKVIKPLITSHPQTVSNVKTIANKEPLNSFSTAKTVFHVSYNFLNYFLFPINPESDPYNDFDRQLMVYGLKAGAYLTLLGGIFELMRNFKIGLSLNGGLEIASIFLISAILFFFGENLSILFKPSNPYQVHEVV